MDGGVIGSCIGMSLPCFYLCFLVSYVVRWSQTESEEYGHVMSRPWTDRHGIGGWWKLELAVVLVVVVVG